MTPSEKRKRRRANRMNRYILLILVLILLALIFMLGNQFSIMVMQNETNQKIDDLSNENTQEEQILGNAQKVAEIEEKEPLNTTYGVQLTTEQRDIVCRVVAAEARGEDLQSQMAVANVILDRSQLWDMPVTEVVLAEGQFAEPYQGEISDKTKLAVANVFDGNMRVFEGGTTHFHDDSIEPPYWADNKVNRGNVGRLRFYGN